MPEEPISRTLLLTIGVSVRRRCATPVGTFARTHFLISTPILPYTPSRRSLSVAQPAPAENLCQLPLPGELLYFYDGSSNVANNKKPVAEICVVYGRGVVLRGPEGVPTHCSLFART